MKIQPFQIFFLSSFFCLLASSAKAADFSQAQQTYIPPTYIQRNANAWSNNNWNYPPLNPNASVAPSGFSLNSVLNGIINPSSQSSYPGQNFNPSTTTTTSTWSKLQNFASQVQNIPGASTAMGSIQSRVSSLLQSGNYGDAENVSRAGLKYYPNNGLLKTQFATATVAEAQTLLSTQNYDLAGKKAREALVADPNNKAAKVVVGKVLQAQGLDPHNAEGHVAAADSLTQDGRLLESSVEYKMALDIKPNAPAHVGLGNLAMGKGQVAEAGRHFEQALSIDPNNALAYRQRAALHYVNRDLVSANSDLSKSVSLNPNDPLAANALVGLWKQQVASAPNSANSHLGLARAYFQTNNLDAAKAEYKTVASMDPNNPALPAAREAFKAALSKQASDQCVQAAKTLDGQGALFEAHQKMMEATSYTPNDPQVLLYHGQISERMGLPDQARDAYMSVLKSDPSNVQAAQRLKMLSKTAGMSANPAQSWGAPMPTNQPSYGNTNPNGFTGTPMSGQQFGNVNPNPGFSQAPQMMPQFNQPMPNTSNPILNAPSNYSAPPALNGVPNTAPNSGIDNIPFKAPIPINPKPQNQSYNPNPNDYYGDPQVIYYANSAEVNTLANFASCLRALVLSEKQALQNSSDAVNKNNGGFATSINLSSAQPGYF